MALSRRHLGRGPLDEHAGCLLAHPTVGLWLRHRAAAPGGSATPLRAASTLRTPVCKHPRPPSGCVLTPLRCTPSLDGAGCGLCDNVALALAVGRLRRPQSAGRGVGERSEPTTPFAQDPTKPVGGLRRSRAPLCSHVLVKTRKGGEVDPSEPSANALFGSGPEGSAHKSLEGRSHLHATHSGDAQVSSLWRDRPSLFGLRPPDGITCDRGPPKKNNLRYDRTMRWSNLSGNCKPIGNTKFFNF